MVLCLTKLGPWRLIIDIADKIGTYTTMCIIFIFERDKNAKILGLLLVFFYGTIRKKLSVSDPGWSFCFAWVMDNRD